MLYFSCCIVYRPVPALLLLRLTYSIMRVSDMSLPGWMDPFLHP
jgi:hypothetical protein